MENKFITLSNQRSGSSPFQRMLGSHPKIVARQEILRNISPSTTAGNLIIDAFREDKKGTVSGFKVQYNQITPMFWGFIEQNNIKVIQLIRRDLLEMSIWFGNHHIGDTKGGLGPPLVVQGKVEAKIDEVLGYMVWLKERIDENRHRAGFTVYYKDFTNNENVNSFYDTEVRTKLLAFLGVNNKGLRVEANVKNVRGKSEDIVTNWNELISEMKRRGIERYYNGIEL